MDTLDILLLIAALAIALAVLLFYYLKKVPIKKLDIEPPLRADTEFASEISPPEPEPEPLQQYEPQLPSSYGESGLIALVRDPHRVHLYWELTEDWAEKFRQGWDNAKGNFLLRVYCDNCGELMKLYDVPIDNHARQWYIEVPDNATIIVDLIHLHPDGSYITLLRSNPVTTPRAFMSDIIDEEWMLVDDKQRKLYKKIGLGNGPSSPSK